MNNSVVESARDDRGEERLMPATFKMSNAEMLRALFVVPTRYYPNALPFSHFRANL